MNDLTPNELLLITTHSSIGYTITTTGGTILSTVTTGSLSGGNMINNSLVKVTSSSMNVSMTVDGQVQQTFVCKVS